MNDPRVSDDDFLRVEANGCPMSSCAAPAGSPCRTGRGWVAAQYHTARFRLVPQLAKALSVPVPPLRKPGSSWTELPRPPAPDAAPAGHARVGYARASTIRQSLDTQVDSLRGGRHPDLRREDLHPRPHPARARVAGWRAGWPGQRGTIGPDAVPASRTRLASSASQRGDGWRRGGSR